MSGEGERSPLGRGGGALLVTEACLPCLPGWSSLQPTNRPTYHCRMAIAKPFMGAKMRQRVRMFGGRTEELFELIPRESLPVEEFGGSHADNGMEWFEAQREAERREEEAAAVVVPEGVALVV